MELVESKKTKRVYTEDDKRYTMIDMGSYVGHNSREWYETSPEVWKLMFYDDSKSHIEALVDDQGDFSRIISESEGVKRVIQISGSSVYSDLIVVGESPDGFYSDEYYALDGDIYSSNKYPLDDYLSTTPTFTYHDEVFEGKVPDSEMILTYLAKNEELRELINSEKRALS